MEIKKTNENNSLVVKIIGRLDTTTAPELEASLRGDIENETKIILDFSELDYVSSAGLRVLLATHKQMTAKGGSLIIKSVKDEVMEVFDMTGFSSFLKFQD